MEELEKLREKIDLIDEEIIERLYVRTDLSKKIGKIKKDMGKDVMDGPRENIVKNQWEELSKTHDLPADKIVQILDIILSISRSEQEKV